MQTQAGTRALNLFFRIGERALFGKQRLSIPKIGVVRSFSKASEDERKNAANLFSKHRIEPDRLRPYVAGLLLIKDGIRKISGKCVCEDNMQLVDEIAKHEKFGWKLIPLMHEIISMNRPYAAFWALKTLLMLMERKEFRVNELHRNFALDISVIGSKIAESRRYDAENALCMLTIIMRNQKNGSAPDSVEKIAAISAGTGDASSLFLRIMQDWRIRNEFVPQNQ
ncbi:hypothetical protein KJ780_01170 [Candidatus Micrarchaeota archaeon]|nr:hypothetical protein [Candidatus Micrarchaeota archaeon]